MKYVFVIALLCLTFIIFCQAGWGDDRWRYGGWHRNRWHHGRWNHGENQEADKESQHVSGDQENHDRHYGHWHGRHGNYRNWHRGHGHDHGHDHEHDHGHDHGCGHRHSNGNWSSHGHHEETTPKIEVPPNGGGNDGEKNGHLQNEGNKSMLHLIDVRIGDSDED